MMLKSCIMLGSYTLLGSYIVLGSYIMLGFYMILGSYMIIGSCMIIGSYMIIGPSSQSLCGSRPLGILRGFGGPFCIKVAVHGSGPVTTLWDAMGGAALGRGGVWALRRR